ncbi:hypothetical protein KR52_02915 [Synechococcus sp. KORDI-52]|uniref:hypothetical protein n=1 Tax=Synechococcus sp. KORDI-52 TaxID=585425 RepID=UPI0004E06A7F|nr:hypothetical protein [Synechococcus sp. KORDI-52]AII48110.1 hypothetical protein KR52_02915 [Synechococcus sp. KORDI-52]
MPKQAATTPRILLAAAAALLCQACSGTPTETRLQDAKPGDALVTEGETTITLTKAFRPGTPNGLFDGGVAVSSPAAEAKAAEVNAVCSMPNLPNWPNYDNIYGRWLESGETPGAEGGNTDWQLLIYFDGTTKNKGREKAPAWAQRLAQNACRKGDFQDN